MQSGHIAVIENFIPLPSKSGAKVNQAGWQRYPFYPPLWQLTVTVNYVIFFSLLTARLNLQLHLLGSIMWEGWSLNQLWSLIVQPSVPLHVPVSVTAPRVQSSSSPILLALASPSLRPEITHIMKGGIRKETWIIFHFYKKVMFQISSIGVQISTSQFEGSHGYSFRVPNFFDCKILVRCHVWHIFQFTL